MFNKRMTAVIIGITLALGIALLFPACNKDKSGKDYSGLLTGDFSVVAGIYVNGSGYKEEIKADGKTTRGWKRTNASYGAVYEGWSKTYNWQENPPPGAEASPIPWVLWPVGVDVLVDGKVVKTDTSKERITIAGFDPPTAEELLNSLYYRETSDTATPEKKSGKAAGKESYDYSKILKGDFSDFAGSWRNGKDDRYQLYADGLFAQWSKSFGFSFDETSGRYEWGVGGGQDSDSVKLYPVGVDAYNAAGKLIQSDKTKVRLFYPGGYGYPSSSDDLFYMRPRENTAAINDELGSSGPQDDTPISTGPSYFYATSNLRLRSEPDTSKDNRIAGITQGNRVELIELGQSETIDNMNARWFKVKTENGTVGWVFSGYLTATNPNKFYDYAKILKGNLTDFAGNWKNGNGENKTLRKDGTFVKGQKASGFTSQNNPKQASGGDFYMWGVNAEGGGFAVALFPAGVDIMGYDGIIKTDKTKVRLTMGQDLPSSNKDVFYPE